MRRRHERTFEVRSYSLLSVVYGSFGGAPRLTLQLDSLAVSPYLAGCTVRGERLASSRLVPRPFVSLRKKATVVGTPAASGLNILKMRFCRRVEGTVEEAQPARAEYFRLIHRPWLPSELSRSMDDSTRLIVVGPVHDRKAVSRGLR